MKIAVVIAVCCVFVVSGYPHQSGNSNSHNDPLTCDQCKTSAQQARVHANCTAGALDDEFCDCLDGYSRHHACDECEDIDECKNKDDDCDDNEKCKNTMGSFLCVCRHGYSYDAGTEKCEDEDDCYLSGCSDNAHCNDNGGMKWLCSCDDGYELTFNGLDCQDILECGLIDDCPEGSTCIDGDASYRGYRCECNNEHRHGFMIKGRQCVDIPECDLGLDHCSPYATCKDDCIKGGYTCECMEGYKGDGYMDNCEPVSSSSSSSSSSSDSHHSGSGSGSGSGSSGSSGSSGGGSRKVVIGVNTVVNVNQ